MRSYPEYQTTYTKGNEKCKGWQLYTRWDSKITWSCKEMVLLPNTDRILSGEYIDTDDL
jgi:hypothetical protein